MDAQPSLQTPRQTAERLITAACEAIDRYVESPNNPCIEVFQVIKTTLNEIKGLLGSPEQVSQKAQEINRAISDYIDTSGPDRVLATTIQAALNSATNLSS